MSVKFKKISVAISFVILVLPCFSYAQMMPINTPYTLSNELGVDIIPSYPRPNENVFINLSMYTANLDSADIAWYKDGKQVLSGKGEKKYSFVAGPVGQEIKIEVKIRLQDGASFSKSFVLNPASVDVVWEANSYVPPFYQGKALHPRQGSLKLVAMPEFVKDGKRIPPQNLIYKWSNGITVYEAQSGYGKNSVVVDGSLFGRTEKITVMVTDPVNNLVAEGFINISPVDPEIVFYEISPYYGYIFDSAIIQNFSLKTDEVQVLAAPFYFTNGDTMVYNWRLNGQTIPNLSNSRTAIFRRPEGESGKSSISLSMEVTNRILQQADNSLMMNFEK